MVRTYLRGSWHCFGTGTANIFPRIDGSTVGGLAGAKDTEGRREHPVS